ncbi:MAG: phosphatase PAP2 family protein [Sphingobacterium sp.]|uniref:phosphatase PAP2 family protein n=1 Tax=Sphingobacterium sp. JB170 TaxID=1434842 RepID=UPI00097F57C7|nr:phosphatase PAP2 family protein [Sphingobacterium sp. JB170]SJN38543.1 putative membrane-associated phospholipid phosphatase [Sphingobacterium sp. JB170]
MWNQLIHFDQELFLAVNQGLSNPFFDWLLPILRNPYTWAPLYLFLIIFFIKHYGKMGIIIVAFTLANFGVSDLVSSRVVKNTIKRVRPCNDLVFKNEVNIRIRCGSGYSFTSSHATNHFAMAFFWIVLFRRRWKHAMWLAITWASLIAISQIYVGVHYPLDILAGAALGILIGTSIGYLFKHFFPAFFKNNDSAEPTTI